MKRTDAATQAHLFRRLSWQEIDESFLCRLIGLAREEDLGCGGLVDLPPPGRRIDVTTASAATSSRASASLVAREPLVVCGLPILPLVLEIYGGGVIVQRHVEDGTGAAPGTLIASLQGPAPILLQAERLMLNFLQHLSGIASETATHVEALGDTTTRLLDTRKTTPGWRLLEKYAVACGGGWNHRLGLFDRVMLKDNHLAAGGATGGERLAAAVRAAKEAQPDLVIEVEVDLIEQIPPVLEAGADVILLDNFPLEELKAAQQLIGDQAYTEASGGVSLQTLPALGQIGLDFVSCGAITHQSRWKDIGMDWA
jgi:nicotinate-nucleotide pyrophosphorylase (carboxylating)